MGRRAWVVCYEKMYRYVEYGFQWFNGLRSMDEGRNGGIGLLILGCFGCKYQYYLGCVY